MKKVYSNPDKGIFPLLEPRYLVKDGQSNYKILVDVAADVCTKFAAKELQEFIEKISGATLPVVHTVSDQDVYISVGNTPQAEFIEVDEESLNRDGFYIISQGDNVYIKGWYPRATLYGVYDFLESVYGVKFIAYDYTYIPKCKDLELPLLKIKEVPDFETRGYFGQCIVEFPLNAARMRMSCQWDTNVEEYGGGWMSRWDQNELHSMFSLLPQSDYIPTHPEWYDYAAHDIMPDGSIKGGQICLSNAFDDNDEYIEGKDSNINEIVKKLKQRILTHPNTEYFVVAQMDGNFPNPCPRCRAMAKRNGTFGGAVMLFINKIAEKIEEWAKTACPNRRIRLVSFAYSWSNVPPVVKKLGKYVPVNEKVVPRDNVAVMHIPKRRCMYHTLRDKTCSYNSEGLFTLQGWGAITKNYMIWDHVTNFIVHHFYFPHNTTIKKNILEYKNAGASTVLPEVGMGEARYYSALLDCYLYSKLLWNTGADVNELTREFNRYYFGEKYSTYVEAYLNLMESHYVLLNEKAPFHTCGNLLYEYGKSDFLNPDYYPIEFLQKAEKIILDAMDKVRADGQLSQQEKEDLLHRLTGVLVTPEMMILWNYDAYFSEGKKEYAKKVIGHLEYLDAVEYGERRSLESLKKKFDLDYDEEKMHAFY